jgi:hypothetical protein
MIFCGDTFQDSGMVRPGVTEGAAMPILVVKKTRRETMATNEITFDLFKIRTSFP